MPKGTDAGDRGARSHVANGALKLMPKGTDVGDRGVGSELICVANGALKLMPKGTDAGDRGVGSELVVANGALKLMPKGTGAGDKARNPWCLFKGKGFIPPILEPLAGLGEWAGCHLLLYRLRIFASISATSVCFISFTRMWVSQHAAWQLPVEIYRRQRGRFLRSRW
jgi:hypothetical protein